MYDSSSEAESRMKTVVIDEFIPNVVYLVTKGNSDGSIKAGDLIYFDGKYTLWAPAGFANKDELTDEIMDFESRPSNEHFLCGASCISGRKFIAWMQKTANEMVYQAKVAREHKTRFSQ